MTNCQGPMARRVADLRLALEIISAPDPDARDPRWVPAPLQGPAVEGATRVAVVRDPMGAGIDPHVRTGIDRAAGWLVDAGYEIVDAEPPQIAEAVTAWIETTWADVGLLWPGLEPVAGPHQIEFVEACLAQGVFSDVDRPAQLDAWKAVHRIGSAWSRFLQDHPVVLSPVCCERPWLVDEDVSRVAEIARAMRMVVPLNILGLPACAVPVGSEDGLPQGVQLIGARFREDLLLDAAQAVEDRAPVLAPIQPRVTARV